jgi:hypothetical protein
MNTNMNMNTNNNGRRRRRSSPGKELADFIRVFQAEAQKGRVGKVGSTLADLLLSEIPNTISDYHQTFQLCRNNLFW